MSDPILFFVIVVAIFVVFFFVKFRESKRVPNPNPGIVQMVVHSTSPLVNSIKLIHGRLSPTVYFDYYLMGYIYSTITFHVLLYSGGKLPTQEKGYVLMNVCAALFGDQGREFLRVATGLVESDVNDEFKQGINDAKKSLLVAHGIEHYLDDPFVNQIRKELQLLPDSEKGGNPNTDLGGLLQARLFGDYLLEKYGPGSDKWSPK